MTAGTASWREGLVRRALFGFLGFYLGSLAGLFIFLPFGYGTLLFMWLGGLAGAIAVAAESDMVRRTTIAVALAMTVVLYVLWFVSA